MQFKPVPAPPVDLTAVESIVGAMPDRAGAVDDCCHHLSTETRLETRSDAETWLTFLRALELVVTDPAGYRRAESALDRLSSASEQPLEADVLPTSFRERVYGAEAVLETLEQADEPRSVDGVVEAIPRRLVSTNRREEAVQAADSGTERVRRLLEWAVLLEIANRSASDDRYWIDTGN